MLKYILHFFLVVFFFTFVADRNVGSVAAQRLAQTQDEDQSKSASIPELEVLRRLDSNADGILQTKEIPQSVQAFVDSLVKQTGADNAVDSKNGSINLTLLAESIETEIAKQKSEFERPQPTDEQCIQYAIQLIHAYDKDKDGRLDSSEYSKLADQWMTCDANSDLQLDVVEVASGIKYALKFPTHPDGSFDLETNNQATKELQEAHSQWQVKQQQLSEAREQNSLSTKKPDLSRQYAQNLVATYDADQSGSLEPEELKRIGSGWAKADLNGDGSASVGEVQVRFQEYASQKSPASETMKLASQAKTSKPATRKQIDYLNASFEQLDTDSDGRIKMHEFAEEFDGQVLNEYYLRDSNRDGVISSREWKRFQSIQNDLKSGENK